MFKERKKDRCNQSSCRFDNIKYNIALKQSMLPGNVGIIQLVFIRILIIAFVRKVKRWKLTTWKMKEKIRTLE